MTIELTADEWGAVLDALNRHAIIQTKQQDFQEMSYTKWRDLEVGIEKLHVLCGYRLQGDIHCSGQMSGVMMDVGDYQHWCRRSAINAAAAEENLRINERMFKLFEEIKKRSET